MRIYTKSGDLAFSVFNFPDGQPHFRLETYEREFETVTIEVSIRSPLDLFTTLLANDVLRQHGYSQVNLDIRYLMGARMDRAINSLQPFTLQTVARLINGAGFTKVRILDAHSEVATRLIRNSTNVLPHEIIKQVLATIGPVCVVSPDKGAYDRVNALVGETHWIRQCSKKRDSQTGALSGFNIDDIDGVGVLGSHLIIDDICDGGGTFVGLAKELRKAGATKIFLFVTHGIFSKGLPLDGINRVFTTDSFGWTGVEQPGYLVPIPISMKDMK